MSIILFLTMIAAFPLALYFFRVACWNLRKYPCVISGLYDHLTLVFALSGLVLIGPGQVCMPIQSLVDKGLTAWLMLLMLYFLLVFLLFSFLRKRMVIYNITRENLQLLFDRLEENEGLEVHRLGNSIELPGLGIQIFCEESLFFKNISLIATRRQTDYNKGAEYNKNWQKLENLLFRQAANIPTNSNLAVGLGFLLISLLLAALVIGIATCPEIVVNGLLSSI